MSNLMLYLAIFSQLFAPGVVLAIILNLKLKSLTEKCLLFGSIMSAVDPVTVISVFEEVKVNTVLYISVFGESIINDGVSVVLYQVFEGFLEIGDEAITAVNVWRAVVKFFIVAGGGTIMGCVFGYIGSFVFKVA